MECGSSSAASFSHSPPSLLLVLTNPSDLFSMETPRVSLDEEEKMHILNSLENISTQLNWERFNPISLNCIHLISAQFQRCCSFFCNKTPRKIFFWPSWIWTTKIFSAPNLRGWISLDIVSLSIPRNDNVAILHVYIHMPLWRTRRARREPWKRLLRGVQWRREGVGGGSRTEGSWAFPREANLANSTRDTKPGSGRRREIKCWYYCYIAGSTFTASGISV